MSTLQVSVEGFLADVVLRARINSPHSSTLGDVVRQLHDRLVTMFNEQLGTDLDPDRCETFVFPQGYVMNQPISDVFSGQDNARLLVFVVPPTRFIADATVPHSLVQNQYQTLLAVVQKNVQDVRSLQSENTSLRKKIQDLESEVEDLQSQVEDLHLQNMTFKKILNPLFCRIVLDLARKHVLKICGFSERTRWAQVSGRELCAQLPEGPFRPPNEALSLLYQPSSLRDDGDEVAHNADKEELAMAISQYHGQDRKALEALFEFIFEERFYSRI